MGGNARELVIGALAVHEDVAVVVDRALPVAAEVDLHTGATQRLYVWDLPPARRDRELVADVEITEREILVASPASGGLVRIDRATGDVGIVPLPAELTMVLTDGTSVWLVGEAVEDEEDDEDDADAARHPVVWEEPSPELIDHARRRLSGFAVQRDGEWVSMADALEPPSLAWWQENDDAADTLAHASPLWRLDGDQTVPIGHDGAIAAGAVIRGSLVAVSWLADDPLIKRVAAGNSLGYVSPSSVVVIDRNGSTRRIARVTDDNGDVVVDGDDVWLLGFVDDPFDEERTEVRSLDLTTPAIGATVASRFLEPVAVVRGLIVDFDWSPPRSGPWEPDFATREPQLFVRIVGVDGNEVGRSPIPPVDAESARVTGAHIWLAHTSGTSIVGVDVESGNVRTIEVHEVCPAVPALQPDGVDLEAWETEQLEHLRGSLLGGWRSADGTTSPFIEGVMFGAMERRGSFPDSELVVLFTSIRRPGIQFARRIRLYDELGNLEGVADAEIWLMEDVESAARGLPPVDQCVPDDDGIVWF
jgi:hypothetical protein